MASPPRHPNPDHLAVQRIAVREDHLGHGAAITDLIPLADGHILAEHHLGRNLLRPAAEVLPGLGGIHGMEADLDLPVLGGEDGERVAVGDADYLGGEVGGLCLERPEGEEQNEGKAFHANRIGQLAILRQLSQRQAGLF